MIKKFSILSLLNNLGDEYILLKKWDDFPAFLPGSDVDVLVIDRFAVSEKAQEYLHHILAGEEVFLRVGEGNKHIHLDLMNGNDILIRLDLIDSLDCFTRFSVQDAIKVKIFLDRENISVDNQEVFVLSHEFDLLIRYFEYLEWFERRPDKMKHLDYILANSTQEQRLVLINNAHRFIRFHHARWQEENPPKNVPVKSRKQALKEIARLTKAILYISWKSIRLKIS